MLKKVKRFLHLLRCDLIAVLGGEYVDREWRLERKRRGPGVEGGSLG